MLDGGDPKKTELKKGKTNIVMFVGLQGAYQWPFCSSCLRQGVERGRRRPERSCLWACRVCAADGCGKVCVLCFRSCSISRQQPCCSARLCCCHAIGAYAPPAFTLCLQVRVRPPRVPSTPTRSRRRATSQPWCAAEHSCDCAGHAGAKAGVCWALLLQMQLLSGQFCIPASAQTCLPAVSAAGVRGYLSCRCL